MPYFAQTRIAARSVLVLAPHPDDEVFGCGGALLQHVAAGCPIAVVVLTDGAFGKEADERKRVGAMREAESLAAAQLLGYPAPSFWRFADRALEYGEGLVLRIMQVARSAGADLVYAPSLYEMHPDHRACAMAAVEAVRRLGLGVRLAMYEVGVPLAPNVLLDISGVAERKLAGMRCFASQLAVQAYDDHIVALNRYRTYTLPAQVTAAEAYGVYDSAQLANEPQALFASAFARQARLGVPMRPSVQQPLVSIMIRSMDRAVLGEALDSVSVQTYPNIEVVLVNARGGAHSDAGAWCGRFPMRMVNAHGPALSRSEAANAGLDAAQGDWLAFLDDDDTLDPDHVASLVDLALAQANAPVVVYSGVRARMRGDRNAADVQVFASVTCQPHRLLLGNFIPIHAPLFPKSLLLQGARVDTALDLYEDWDFWLQLSLLAPFVYSGRITATYFLGGDSQASPLAPDPWVTQTATLQFFEKWASRMQGPTLVAIANLVKQQEEALQAQGKAHQEVALQATKVRQELVEVQEQLQSVLQSTSWRVTGPLRALSLHLQRPRAVARALAYHVTASGGVGALTRRIGYILRNEGISGVARRVKALIAPQGRGQISGVSQGTDYVEWVRRYDTLNSRQRSRMQERVAQLPVHPLLSIVMPVYNPPLTMLRQAIDSVRNQMYGQWELCIANDASAEPEIRPVLDAYAQQDARIKVLHRETNGHISAASNSALELASGEFVLLLDHDDVLHELALFWVADAIARHPQAGLIYTDEDKITEDGARFAPYFKPDWNPDLFLSHNLVCHLAAYRASLIRELGGFRLGYEGAQDYDLALRCTERLQAQDIVHIPRVLYHWRSHPGSTAKSGDEKGYAALAGQRALDDHFARMQIAAKAELLDFGMYRARYALPSTLPLVSLIIPTRNALELVRQCIDSVVGKTTYANFEIIVIDNNSDDPQALQYFQDVEQDPRIRVIRDEQVFNYSALNNAAVARARGDYVCLLNNDIEVISPDWLSEMMSLATQPGVGAVGARLWYPDDTLQHGGVITGLGGVAGHSHKHLPKGAPGYFHHAQLIKTLSAVTAACLVIKKSIYQQVNGLNETDLKVAFNDVDFCLRVREAGYRNIWTPYAELYHHESATRGFEDTPEKRKRFAVEVHYLKRRWGASLALDPAYNPNLTVVLEDFSYAWPPRLEPL